MRGFHDKSVFITGASAGIGLEMARHLAGSGARLALFARRLELLEQAKNELSERAPGLRIYVGQLDARDRAETLRAFAAARAAIGPCDVLIANAGVAVPVPAARFDSARAWSTFETNVGGVLYGVEAVLPDMLARRSGQIVGISSLASYRSFPETHVYCGSKSALSAVLEGLRLELCSKGIAVTTICPGFIRTAMTSGNNFPMPFLMDAQAASARILRAVAARRKVLNFPRRLYWLILFSRLLPDRLMARLSTPKPGLSHKSG